ncbi:hypothetical protein ACWDZ4_02625 [Streptomyces sp. NPDC003016]
MPTVTETSTGAADVKAPYSTAVPAWPPTYAARTASSRPGARAVGSVRPESGNDGMLTAPATGLFLGRALGQETGAEAAAVFREALVLLDGREELPGEKVLNYAVRAAE